MFEFKDFDCLTDGEIDLVLAEKLPADITKGYVPAYLFKITLHDSPDEIGGIVLRVGENENIYYGGHISYGIDERYRGRHYAAKACLLLREVADYHSLKRLIIACNPDNVASKKVCEQIGAKLIETVDVPVTSDMYSDRETKKCIYEFQINQKK